MGYVIVCHMFKSQWFPVWNSQLRMYYIGNSTFDSHVIYVFYHKFSLITDFLFMATKMHMLLYILYSQVNTLLKIFQFDYTKAIEIW